MTQEDNSEQQGYQIREGLHGRTVAHASQVPDNATVVVDGMEIKASMAREMGLLDAHVPDSGLSVGNAFAQKPVEPSPAPIETTGHQDYDDTVAELNAQVEAGTMTDAEATEYSTALGQIALADMTVTAVTEKLDSIADGTIDPATLPAQERQIIKNLEDKVTAAATSSARTELGDAGFARLSQVASVSPEVYAAVRQYSSMRALGRADVSWTVLLQDIEDDVAGIR